MGSRQSAPLHPPILEFRNEKERVVITRENDAWCLVYRGRGKDAKYKMKTPHDVLRLALEFPAVAPVGFTTRHVLAEPFRQLIAGLSPSVFHWDLRFFFWFQFRFEGSKRQVHLVHKQPCSGFLAPDDAVLYTCSSRYRIQFLYTITRTVNFRPDQLGLWREFFSDAGVHAALRGPPGVVRIIMNYLKEYRMCLSDMRAALEIFGTTPLTDGENHEINHCFGSRVKQFSAVLDSKDDGRILTLNLP